ncbi:hypothetical protein HYPP_04053 [Hyphomicrobium sp. ghe19]|nr:hypothetical protein HYPP_04053 [Hyphomicrobium sp. ghe19]
MRLACIILLTTSLAPVAMAEGTRPSAKESATRTPRASATQRFERKTAIPVGNSSARQLSGKRMFVGQIHVGPAVIDGRAIRKIR